MILNRKRFKFFAFLTVSALTVLLAVTAAHLVLNVSRTVHQYVDEIVFLKDFLIQKNLCISACPGAQNCTEWDDCVFHHPQACGKLGLRCMDDDGTLYTDEVLTPHMIANNWIMSISIAIDVLMFVLVFGMLLISVYYFRWSLVKVILLENSKPALQHKMFNKLHFRQLCRQCHRANVKATVPV